MPLRDHEFRVEFEQLSPTEGWYTLAGKRYGPFASPEAAEIHLLSIMARWKVRARELGGWCWRPLATKLMVTLPEDLPVEGGRPPTPWWDKSE